MQRRGERGRTLLADAHPEQPGESQPHEVGSTRQLHHLECRRRREQQRGQAGGGSYDVHDRAGVNAEDGDQAGARRPGRHYG